LIAGANDNGMLAIVTTNPDSADSGARKDSKAVPVTNGHASRAESAGTTESATTPVATNGHTGTTDLAVDPEIAKLKAELASRKADQAAVEQAGHGLTACGLDEIKQLEMAIAAKERAAEEKLIRDKAWKVYEKLVDEFGTLITPESKAKAKAPGGRSYWESFSANSRKNI
jgi:hypothetical protein